MANIKSAKKAAKQSEKRRKVNLARRTEIKTSVKKVMAALEQEKDATKAKTLLQEAEAKIARAKGKNLLHKNTASRKISRLAKRVSAAGRAKK
jgi:small subunit ribosomal protein S20